MSFFRKWGYLVVDGALTAAQVETLPDERFVFLLDNAPVPTRIRALLGTCVLLGGVPRW